MTNTIHVTGNVTADADYRSSNPKAPLVFTVADDFVWKDDNGEWQKITTFHRVITFRGGLADYLKERAVKGARITLRGRLTHNRYRVEGEGKDRIEPEILLDRDGQVDVIEPRA